MIYPRPLTQIHQIEITSRCNLRCVYCPSPNLPRAKVDMSDRDFTRALEWAAHFEKLHTQGELALTGIGESLLHPHFVDYVKEARYALPHNRITIATNGILLTDELCAELAPYKPEIFVSLHKPERAAHAMMAAEQAGILAGCNVSFITESFDWAGQLNWPVRIRKGEVVCEYLRAGAAVVLADGRITTCCLDASGAGVVGTVWDPIGTLSIKPYSLCESCHMEVP